MEKHSSSRLRFIYLPAQPSGIVLGKTTLRFNNTTNNLFVSLFLTCRKAESPVFSFLCSFHLHLPYLALIIASSGFVVVVYLLCCFQLILCSNRKKKKKDVQMLLLSSSQAGGEKHKTLQGQDFWSKRQVTNQSGPRTLHNGGGKLELWRQQDLCSCLLCDSRKEVDTLPASVSLSAHRQMSLIPFCGVGPDIFLS